MGIFLCGITVYHFFPLAWADDISTPGDSSLSDQQLSTILSWTQGDTTSWGQANLQDNTNPAGEETNNQDIQITNTSWLPQIISNGSILTITWIFAYSGTSMTPPWFLKMVDDITNPQYMIYMKQDPISNNGGGFAYDEMKSYAPSAYQAIPSKALMDLLVSSNHTSTRVTLSWSLNDPGNRSDWIYDPVFVGTGQYGPQRNLMSVDGGPIWDYSTQSGPYFVAGYNFTHSNKIRTIYTSLEYIAPPEPFSCSLVTDIPESECNVLVTMYTADDGTNRGYPNEEQHWMQDGDTTACDWEGIICSLGDDEHYHVTWIELEEEGLNGNIPDSIDQLTYLQEFDIYGNSIGALPETIGNLHHLQSLEFSENGISSLPDSIGNLTGLTEIYGYDNSLQSLPASIGNLTQLTDIDLSDNQLISLPESMGNLTNLSWLYLDSNHLTWLPESFTGLTSLQELYVDNNCIDSDIWSTSLADFFDNLDTFEFNPENQENCPANEVTYSYSQWNEYYNSVLIFDHLTTWVHFTPPEVDQSLVVYNDNEDYFFFSLSGFTLQSIGSPWDGILYAPQQAENPALWTGGLPLASSGLVSRDIAYTIQAGSHTTLLSANGSGFTFNIWIPDTQAGEVFHIYRSPDYTSWESNTPDLTCSIDEDGICAFSSNEAAYFTFIHETNFSCDNVVDVSSWECQALVDLYLATDGSHWSNHTNWLKTNYVRGYRNESEEWVNGRYWVSGEGLNELELNNNNLSGTVPASFSQLKNLFSAYLANNHITSVTDGAFSGMQWLQEVDIQSNSLIRMPHFTNLPNLNQIYLYDNAISSFPETTFDWVESLSEFDIENNNLISLPENIGTKLPNLEYFYVSDNHLTSLPESIMNMENLQEFYTYDNCIFYNTDSALFAFLTSLDDFESDEGVNSDYCPWQIVYTDHEWDTVQDGQIIIPDRTSTWATFTQDGSIHLEWWEWTNWLNFPTNEFSINVLTGSWDGILYWPRPFTDPILGERDLPPASGDNLTRAIVTTVQAWANGASLWAQWGLFTIKLSVDVDYSGQTLFIYRSANGESWIANTPDASCNVSAIDIWEGQFQYVCEFQTDHLSYFTTVQTISTWTVVAPIVWWGGGGSMLSKDYCPDGDLSSDYYDGSCLMGSGSLFSWAITSFPLDSELTRAYFYAYGLGITSISPITQADLQGNLLRSHMAKMMVTYAVKVLKQKPDTARVCTFTDTDSQTPELQYYMKLACKLGLMGIHTDGSPMNQFTPNGVVTRADFATVLSRALWGNTYNGWITYYSDHIQALKDAWILTNTENPMRTKELRGWVMLMMMRAKK